MYVCMVGGWMDMHILRHVLNITLLCLHTFFLLLEGGGGFVDLHHKLGKIDIYTYFDKFCNAM